MKLSCKLETECGEDYKVFAEVVFYGVHTVEDVQQALNVIQKAAGFHGVKVKMVHESEEWPLGT
jgi:hypothetical protein